MNAEERQALREKHFNDFCDCPDEHPPFKCIGCSRLGATVVWPCEVIQVLDDFENHLISCDTEQAEIRNECDHFWVSKAGSGYRENPVEVCIKCGMEL